MGMSVDRFRALAFFAAASWQRGRRHRHPVFYVDHL
jgi:hypothetical protein